MLIVHGFFTVFSGGCAGSSYMGLSSIFFIRWCIPRSSDSQLRPTHLPSRQPFCPLMAIADDEVGLGRAIIATHLLPVLVLATADDYEDVDGVGMGMVGHWDGLPGRFAD